MVLQVDLWAGSSFASYPLARLDQKAIGIAFQGFTARLRLDGAIKISHYQGSEAGWIPSDAILAPPRQKSRQDTRVRNDPTEIQSVCER